MSISLGMALQASSLHGTPPQNEQEQINLFETPVVSLSENDLQEAASQAVVLGSQIKHNIYYAEGDETELARLHGLRLGIVDRLLGISSRLATRAKDAKPEEPDWSIREWTHSAIETAAFASSVANGRGWDESHPSKQGALATARNLIDTYVATNPYQSIRFLEKLSIIASINCDTPLEKIICEAQFSAVQRVVARRLPHISVNEAVSEYGFRSDRRAEITERLKSTPNPFEPKP